MSPSSSILLGLLQGLTEFLPVSSSGHLVLAQHLIPGFSQPGVLFDVSLHAGTLLSIVFFFRKKIVKISRKYILLLALGSIPAALFGFLFQSVIEGFFSSIKLVGFALIITSVVNFLTDKARPKRQDVSYKDAGLIGFAQAFAIIPGISRSGSTIFSGTWLGIKKARAAEFSFLLSIPVVLGANLLQFATHGADKLVDAHLYLLGFMAAFLSGCLSINWVLKLLSSRRFRVFSLYCAAVGLLALLII